MRVISDHAVLQSGEENTVFGYFTAGGKVSLVISDDENNTPVSVSAEADGSGRWTMKIPAFEASFKKYTFEFSGSDETIGFEDIVFGELFHISGQSNMELPVSRTCNPFTHYDFIYTDKIREFRVPIECCFGKDTEYEDFRGGEWKTAEEKNLPSMSAAGYWFAAEISEKYNVPVGLLNTSSGGAPVEARMPYSMLSEVGGFEGFITECIKPDYMESTIEKDRLKNEKRYADIAAKDKISDKILADDSGISFRKCTLPFYFREVSELDGFCGKIWFRKKFTIPQDADISSPVLILGTMIDADRVYLNGKYAGETGYMYPPRIYPAPSAVHGENTLLVCLDVKNGKGGFVRGKKYCIKLGDMVIDLSGEWEYAAAAETEYMRFDVFFPLLPLSMYAALTAPAFNVNCRALLWYQGESNDRNAERYSYLFGKFIDMYRRRCGKDIPVIFVQLVNFDDPIQEVPEDSWAVIRNEQLKCLEIPKTDMAVALDLGESNDLHPLNKKDIGKRLSICARRMLYGDTTVPQPNYCRKASVSDNKTITLGFDDNSVLSLKQDAEKSFEIIFTDGTEAFAESAAVSPDGIVLRYSETKTPAKVRCEWENDPVPRLYGADDIPLSPFEITAE